MSLGAIFRLKQFLTRRNLELLDVVLTGLVDPKAASFNPFWMWFGQARGGRVDDVQYTCQALESLRSILRDYLKDAR